MTGPVVAVRCEACGQAMYIRQDYPGLQIRELICGQQHGRFQKLVQALVVVKHSEGAASDRRAPAQPAV